MRVRDRAARAAGDWRGDAVVACGLIAFLLVFLAAHGLLRGAGNMLAAACGAAGVAGSSAGWPVSLLFVPVFLLAYSLGTSAGLWPSVLALLLLGAGLQLAASGFNPFAVVVTAGPWAVGLVVRSRRRLTGQLALRGRELEAEREVFAAEAGRAAGA